MSTNNSISQLLEQFLELNTNALETFERINEAITTDKETVSITLYDDKLGVKKPIQIPAFGYLKREIERLDTNFKSLSGVAGGNANVRLKDGSFRRIHTAKLKGPSKPITRLVSPVNFNTKLNDFFEDFLNPLLTIELTVDGQIPVETERVYVERFLFDSNSTSAKALFDEVYKGRSNVKHSDLTYKLRNDGVKYSIDSNIIDMPIRNIQYTGGFDVANIISTQKTTVVDEVSLTKSIKLFELNKLSYSDASKTMTDTEVIQVGDSLVVNSAAYSTRYKVVSIDGSSSQVELKLIEGFEPIKIGVNSLKIYKKIDTGLTIDINIGYNERQIIFIKPVDPVSKIQSETYSPGIGFFSNELTMTRVGATPTTLARYYKDEVADFGQFIKALKVDYIPPAAVALKPSPPKLDVDNFKVVQINKHLTDNSTTKKIIKLKADKKSAEQSISQSDSAIRRKRSFIYRKKFKSSSERNRHTGELSALINKRVDHSKMFSSLVSDIKATAESTQVVAIAPKFRTRGFWSVPSPKTVGEEVSQDVIKFIIRYRYLSNNGAASAIEQIPFSDSINDVVKTGAFSNWIEIETSVKKRRFNETTEKYEWYFENEEDGSAVNFNSLDLPLSVGESVEVMIKSVSEAGYPANPVTSDYSDSVKIEFPEEFIVDAVTGLVKDNERDSIKVEIMDDLESKGVYSHVNESTEDFAHTANSIASGFLSPEQAPISLYDKLNDMQLEIERLRASIVQAVGELLITIVDEEGNATVVNRNSVVKIHGGYYVQEVSHASDYKGEIINKIFKIQISNTKATQLELSAIINGDRKLEAHSSTSTSIFGAGLGAVALPVNDNEYYKTEGKYDLVPVGYQNVEATDLDAGQFFNSIPSQSTQTNGQFAYSRFKDLTNSKDLYNLTAITTNTSSTNNVGFDQTEVGPDLLYYGLTQPTTSWTDWSANITTPGAGGTANNTSTAIHGVWDGVPAATPVASNDPNTVSYDSSVFPSMWHPFAKFLTLASLVSNGYIGIPATASLRKNELNSWQQTPFKRAFGSINNAATASFRRAAKISFSSEDKYTIGGKSCGSFLYVSPVDKYTLNVDSDNKFGKKRISTGDNNAITLDLVWQYRMTDFNGLTLSGKGRVGGILAQTLNNITYSKTIGIDILAYDERFSFDVELTSQYKPVGNKLSTIPSSALQNFSVSQTSQRTSAR